MRIPNSDVITQSSTRSDDQSPDGPSPYPRPPEELFLKPDHFSLIVHRMQLSQRESDVLCGILVEHKDQAIANQLGISVNTVRTYLVRLFRKLGVKSRAGVLARAFETYYCMNGRSDMHETSQQHQPPLHFAGPRSSGISNSDFKPSNQNHAERLRSSMSEAE